MAPPPAATTTLKLDKKGMMDGFDNDDDDVEDNVQEGGFGRGGPVLDINYSTPYNGRGGRKVKIKQEIPWGATSAATSNPSHQPPLPPATINVCRDNCWQPTLIINSRIEQHHQHEHDGN